MKALSFTLGLFVFWGGTGHALASWLRIGEDGLQRLLLGPALGVASLLLPVFFLNRAGLPVATFAPALSVAMGGLALGLLAWQRPGMPWRAVAWPGLMLLAGLLLIGWPMYRHGFNWLSFVNDDMANYCLAAQRFLENGFYDPPDLAEYFAGRNHSQAFWYMHVAGGARPGAELMLALVWSTTGLNAHQIFMPVIVALHLSLICATAAVVAGTRQLSSRQDGPRPRAVCLSMLLMAVSPLSALGTLYQLIGQVGGLTLMLAALALLCQPAASRRQDSLLGDHLAILILVGGLLVWYPELIPFLTASCLLWLVIEFRNTAGSPARAWLWQRLGAWGLTLLALVLMLNRYLISVFHFMLGQARQGLQLTDGGSVYFPFYMVPSGIGTFWGLLPISHDIQEPLLSAAILVGIGLSAWLLCCLPRQLRIGSPLAIMATVMLLLGALLFYRSNDFGLYKLATYLQPAVTGVLAIRMAAGGITIWKGLGLGLLCSLQALSQHAYVLRSSGESAGGLIELPHASAQALPAAFADFMQAHRGEGSGHYYSDSANVVLAKIQSLYARGDSLLFPAKDFYWPTSKRLQPLAEANGQLAFWLTSRHAYEQTTVEQEIRLDEGQVNRFMSRRGIAPALGERTLIANSPEFTIFNRHGSPEHAPLFRMVPEPKNHLIFIHSLLGNHYYQGKKHKIAFHQLEHDPLFPGRQFSGLGRHLLFMAAGISPQPRLMLELSSTVLRQHESSLPNPVVHGRTQQPLAFVGRGSARLVSAPLEPLMIDGLAYFHIDIGRDGKQFAHTRNGLMALYGEEVALDPRFLTVFARNISLLSEEAFRALAAPSALSRFPADLADDGLQYSGLYEDGWISEQAVFLLSPAAGASTLVVKGMIPLIGDKDFRTTLRVRLGDRIVAERTLGLGEFELRIASSGASGPKWIGLEFDRAQILPGGDGRSTAGLLKFIGFVRE